LNRYQKKDSPVSSDKTQPTLSILHNLHRVAPLPLNDDFSTTSVSSKTGRSSLLSLGFALISESFLLGFEGPDLSFDASLITAGVAVWSNQSSHSAQRDTARLAAFFLEDDFTNVRGGASASKAAAFFPGCRSGRAFD
jgi:hypothetical protein